MSDGVLNTTSTIGGRLELPEVSLIAVSSVALNATLRALRKSNVDIHFGEILLLSDKLPPDFDDPNITWRQIPRITSRQGYSRFVMKDLGHHIKTKFALVVQWDGYVLNAANWRKGFLDYDYIGALWPHFDDAHRVGNGGFSLRSKRLLDVCAQLPLNPGEAEDIAIGRRYRDVLERKHGMSFAPEDLAHDFAYERSTPNGRQFGFHGVLNLARQMSLRELSSLTADLEPGAIGRLEARELVKYSLLNLRPDIAWRVLRNRLKADKIIH